MFNIKLDDNSHNRIKNFDGKKITYDETSVISEWKRCQQCIDMFYQFCDIKK